MGEAARRALRATAPLVLPFLLLDLPQNPNLTVKCNPCICCPSMIPADSCNPSMIAAVTLTWRRKGNRFSEVTQSALTA